jgi:uncharacterized protein
VSQDGRERPPNDRPPRSGRFRILAIDGGGIRGLIPAVLLEALEGLLNRTLTSVRSDPAQSATAALWEGVAEPRIADCFHLIAGTSTGGLLSAGLTTTTPPDRRPKLSAASAARMYEKHGPRIFDLPLWRKVLNPFNLLSPRYPLAQLRNALEDPSVLGDGALQDARTEILITSYDTTLPGPRFFTRWGEPGAGARKATPKETMIDAGLATAAAPTYFGPMKLGLARLADGGVYAGNPALAAISMALRRTSDPAPLEPSDILMISLGTGAWEKPLDYGWGGIFGWLRPGKGGEALLEALLGGQADFTTEAAHMILNGWSATSLPGAGPGGGPVPWWDPTLSPSAIGGGPQFWRYQPSLPEPWAMDDVSKLGPLRQIATDMTRDYQEELERLAELLIRAGPVPYLTPA